MIKVTRMRFEFNKNCKKMIHLFKLYSFLIKNWKFFRKKNIHSELKKFCCKIVIKTSIFSEKKRPNSLVHVLSSECFFFSDPVFDNHFETAKIFVSVFFQQVSSICNIETQQRLFNGTIFCAAKNGFDKNGIFDKNWYFFRRARPLKLS